MKGMRLVKIDWWGAGVICPLPLAVSCFSKIQIGFTFLVPAHPGSPGQRAVKRMCVRVWLKFMNVILLLTSFR